jgi:hypothetical protein
MKNTTLFKVFLLRITSLVLGLTVASITSAQSTNGCGSGWNTYLVPDSLPLGICNFEQSCNNHDVCYGKCDTASTDSAEQNPRCAYLQCKKGGRHFEDDSVCSQSIYKTSEIEAKKRKATCDSRFYSEIADFNNSRPICVAFAALYSKAVQKFGEGAFMGAAPAEGTNENALPISRGNMRAFEQFLKEAGDSELKKVIEDIKKPSTQIDPSRPLRFEKGKGLVRDE